MRTITFPKPCASSRRRFLSQATLLAALAASPRGVLAALQAGRRKRVILDVDLGIDDAVALLLAHYSPALDLVGITTVFGNTSLETGTRNSLYIKEKFGIAADVHAGAAEPRCPRPSSSREPSSTTRARLP